MVTTSDTPQPARICQVPRGKISAVKMIIDHEGRAQFGTLSVVIVECREVHWPVAWTVARTPQAGVDVAGAGLAPSPIRVLASQEPVSGPAHPGLGHVNAQGFQGRKNRGGTANVVRAPRPCPSGSPRMRPPWASTIRLQMARPRPVSPPASRSSLWKKSLNRSGRSTAGIPWTWSDTETLTWPPSRTAET